MGESPLVIAPLKALHRGGVDLWEESKKVGLEINPLKTEEMRVNTIINQVLN